MHMRWSSLAAGLLLVVGCTIKSSNSDAGDDGGGGRGRTVEAGGAGASGASVAAAGAGEGGKGGAAGAGTGEDGKGGAAGGGTGEGGKGGAAGAGTGEDGKGGAAGADNAGGGKGGAAGAGNAGASSQEESLLEIANTELAEGALDAVLDEDTVLTRTVVDDRITHWEVTVTGIPALVVDYGQDTTTVSVDEDLDGIFDLVKTISGSTESDMTVVEQRAGDDESAATRQTLTRTSADEIHMLGEVMTEDGGWETVDETDASTREVYDAAIVVDAGASLCTSDQVRLLEEAAQSVLEKGVDCLKRRGLTGLAASLQSIAAANGFNITCKSMSELAYADVPQWESNQLDGGYHVGPAQIEFNPTCIAAPGVPAPCANNYTTEGLLFHEMLHFIKGAHSLSLVLALKGVLFDPYEEAEKDLIYSCQFACFDSSQLLTKCSCAMCSANYKVCGPECASEAECKDPAKACGKYHCSCDGVDYPSVGECNAACRVSLGCFSGICTPVP